MSLTRHWRGGLIATLALVVLMGASSAFAQITVIPDPSGFSGTEPVITFQGVIPSFAASATVSTITTASGVVTFSHGGTPNVSCVRSGASRPYGPIERTTCGNTDPSDGYPFTAVFPLAVTRVGFEYQDFGCGAASIQFFKGSNSIGTANIPGPPPSGTSCQPSAFGFAAFQSVVPFDRIEITGPSVLHIVRIDNLRFEYVLIPACGNGVVEGTEQCDDGNLTSGDGCSATCTIDNFPPTATCVAASVSASLSCGAPASIDGGTVDPDGDAITVSQWPPSPYPLGSTLVTLIARDSHGATSTCTAPVTVTDSTGSTSGCPAVAPIVPITNPLTGFSNTAKVITFEGETTPFTGVDGVSITQANGHALRCGGDPAPRPFGPAEETICDNDLSFVNGEPIVIAFSTAQTRIGFEARFNGFDMGLKVDFYDGDTFIGSSFSGPGLGPSSPNAWIFAGFDSGIPFTRVVITPANPTKNGYLRLDNIRYESAAPPPYCGDGVVGVGELCDDGNRTSGDGCSAACQLENQAPTATCANVKVNTAPNSCGASASIDAGSSDPNAGDAIATSQSPAGPYPLGDTTVTLTVTDIHGASASCTGVVTVVDATKPSITCPAAATVECVNGAGTASPVATADDNCSVGAPSCNTPASFPPGTTPITCSATDGSGNTASCASSVTVVDTTPPVVTCPAPIVVECSNGGAAATIAATGADSCSSVSVDCTAASGIFPVGTTGFSCTARDQAGLTASCNSSVKVVDTVAPTASCVPGVNPAGKNKPNENAGFFRVMGADTCSPATIKLGNYTLANGENVKITVSPSATGVTPVGTMGPAATKHFVVGPGQANIVVSDGVNQSVASCGGGA